LGNPTISQPTDTSTGAVTSQGEITSDQASGSIYGVVTQSATTPTHAQIVAGQDHTGATADSAAILSAAIGVNTLNFSGLQESISYFTHFTQQNTTGGEATPLTASGFTTIANQSPVVVSPIPDQVAQIGVLFTYDAFPNFTDPDADALTFSAIGLPNGLAINPNTGVISGIPTGGFS